MTSETEIAARPPSVAVDLATLLDDLESGRVRAAEPDADGPDGWRVRPEVKTAILACFAERTTRSWSAGPLQFRLKRGQPVGTPRRDRHGCARLGQRAREMNAKPR